MSHGRRLGARWGGRFVRAVVLAWVGLVSSCGSDSPPGGSCPAGQACGFIDHQYFSTFTCSVGRIGYSWRDLVHCGQECKAAANFGCDASGCNCSDHGTGAWLACTSANNATEKSDKCILSGSGINGETIPCVCR